MRPIKAILAAGLLLFVMAGAAEAAPAEFQFGLALSPSLPRGEFRDVLDKTAWGGTFFFAYRPFRSPVLIGSSLGFAIYGTERWQEWLGLTEPDVLVDVRSTNAIIAWNVFLRFQPEVGFLRPYLDLFAGLHILSTDTRVEEGDSDEDVSGDFSVNNSADMAFAFGAGAGVLFPILRFVKPDGRSAFAMDLDFGIRYARGGRADYLIEGREPGIFDSRTSRTDMLTFIAGLAFSF